MQDNRLERHLKGMVQKNEYAVSPSRFQWSVEQLNTQHERLDRLPTENLDLFFQAFTEHQHLAGG
jgi:hypothetical protein